MHPQAYEIIDPMVTLNEFLQDNLWQNYRFPSEGKKQTYTLKSVSLAIQFAVRLFRKKMSSRPEARIYFATETGTAKRYAEKLKKEFGATFNVKLCQMDE